MAQTNVGRLLRNKIEERINNWASDLAEGSAKDYAAYRQGVGVVQGMNLVLAMLDDLEKEKD